MLPNMAITVVRDGLRILLPASSSSQPFPSEMFGAFALDVSNFQAGSFGTPAFFLALFGDVLSDPCTRRPMEMNRAVIRGGLQGRVPMRHLFKKELRHFGRSEAERRNDEGEGIGPSAYFAVLTSLRNSVIQSSEPMPRHSPIMLNPVKAKPVPVQA